MSSHLIHSIDVTELFRRNRFEQIEAALEKGDVGAARKLAQAVRAEYIDVHDGFRDAIALTLAHIVREYGLETGEMVGRRVVEPMMAGGDPPQYSQPDLKERVKAVAAGWYWHATRFTLTEDDDKVTFTLHPCGSGMRLITENFYPPNPYGPPTAGSPNARLTLSDKATWSTAMNTDFPIYCNHCPEMTHGALLNGSGTFLVESWTPLRKKGLCVQHTFKDVSLVPDEFYRRADLPVPGNKQKASVPQCLFSPDELIDIQKHPLDKLVDHAESGNISAARAALSECYLGWRDSIHDVYRNWIALLWLQIDRDLGREAFTTAVRATAPDLFSHVQRKDAFAWAAFWSIHLRLKDIVDTQEWVEFKVGQESLLQPGVLPCSADWFVEQLNAGIVERGWSEIGRFEVIGSEILHRLPKR